MGNTPPQHDDLVHIRGWSHEQIKKANELLRREKRMYCLTKEDFKRYFAGRNQELMFVFGLLDTDYDGRVDIFEMLLVVTLWSGTTFDQKLGLFFEIFDLMGKGFLKFDELMLLGSVVIQTLKKFVTVDAELSKINFIQQLTQKAMSNASDGGLKEEQWLLWARSCDSFQQLKSFLEAHAPRATSDTLENKIQIRMHGLQKFAERLFEHIERLQDRLPEFTNECIDYVGSLGRRKRWDFTMQNLRQLILSLQRASEIMHISLIDLEKAINEDAISGGTSVLINPERRFKQEQTILELETSKKQSTSDFQEITELLRRLIELTDPLETAFGTEDRLDEEALAVRNCASKISIQKVCDNMFADTEVGGMFGPSEAMLAAGIEKGSGQALRTLIDTPSKGETLNARIARSNGEQVLVAIAEFEPPATHETQMLKLCIGDLVTVIGQDGRGWWYGRKANGKEGWFPPSYVQVQPSHFSSAGS